MDFKYGVGKGQGWVRVRVKGGVRVGVWRPKIVRESQDSLTINYWGCLCRIWTSPVFHIYSLVVNFKQGCKHI